MPGNDQTPLPTPDTAGYISFGRLPTRSDFFSAMFNAVSAGFLAGTAGVLGTLGVYAGYNQADAAGYGNSDGPPAEVTETAQAALHYVAPAAAVLAAAAAVRMNKTFSLSIEQIASFTGLITGAYLIDGITEKTGEAIDPANAAIPLAIMGKLLAQLGLQLKDAARSNTPPADLQVLATNQEPPLPAPSFLERLRNTAIGVTRGVGFGTLYFLTASVVNSFVLAYGGKAQTPEEQAQTALVVGGMITTLSGAIHGRMNETPTLHELDASLMLLTALTAFHYQDLDAAVEHTAFRHVFEQTALASGVGKDAVEALYNKVKTYISSPEARAAATQAVEAGYVAMEAGEEAPAVASAEEAPEKTTTGRAKAASAGLAAGLLLPLIIRTYIQEHNPSVAEQLGSGAAGLTLASGAYELFSGATNYLNKLSSESLAAVAGIILNSPSGLMNPEKAELSGAAQTAALAKLVQQTVEAITAPSTTLADAQAESANVELGAGVEPGPTPSTGRGT